MMALTIPYCIEFRARRTRTQTVRASSAPTTTPAVSGLSSPSRTWWQPHAPLARPMTRSPARETVEVLLSHPASADSRSVH